MIARHWKGVFKREEAENYIHHLKTETFVQISGIEGFVRASILKRTVDEGIEFLIVTVWKSIEAIQRFAGESAEIAVVPEKVQAMAIKFDQQVVHYEIEESFPSPVRVN